MFEFDGELLSDFVTEAREGLSDIESDLLALELDGAAIDLDRVNSLFRAVHSIKGASGFLGLTKIGELSHGMEHVLSEIRKGALIPSPPIVDQLLKSGDLLKQLIERVETSNHVDVSERVRELQRIDQNYCGPESLDAVPIEQTTGAHAETADLAFPLDVAQALVANGQSLLEVEFDLLRDREAAQLPTLQQRLEDVGTILGTYLRADQFQDLPDEPLSYVVMQSTLLDRDQFATFFDVPSERVRDRTHEFAEQSPAESASPPHPVAAPADVTGAGTASGFSGSSPTAAGTPVSKILTAPGAHQQGQDNRSQQSSQNGSHPHPIETGGKSDGVDTPDHSTAKRGTTAETNIRVTVSVLDRLMNLAGELVLGRNQLLQAVQKEDRRNLETVCARIDQVTCELQDAIMQTRMQPVGTVFSKFTRIVRDLGTQLGKKCDLVIHGQSVELDRTIIEAISDPLTHLVRNSMDHGLESPEARQRLGKPAAGTVTLAARHQEGKVLLSISDDGAGIDPAKIRRKAVEKGLLTLEAAAALTDREAVHLIFAPGFSTAEQVTSVSGRGVGMDVVKTNIERLGGSVEVESIVGQGTTILVRLPLTLAIIPCLITSTGGQRLAIPQASIRELARIRPSECADRIGRVNRAEVLKLRGSLLPLVRVSELFADSMDREPSDGTAVTNIVIVEAGQLQFGLVVDQLHDSEEIVVKPLGRHLKHLSFLSGATVLGDGRVAMILDAGGLALRAGLNTASRAQSSAKEQADDDGQPQEQMPTLLFTNHPQEWFAVPMSVVSRIERIRVDQIDTVASQQVLQYRGGTLPILSVERQVDARPPVPSEHIYIIVFRHAGRELGLLAPEIFDIRDLSTQIDETNFQGPGVLGSLIVEGHTVRFLDVYELASPQGAPTRRSREEQSSRLASGVDDSQTTEPTTRESAGGAPTILYAEDSAFFRSKVLKYLLAEGWQVVACEDGLEAWELLSSGQVQPALVLTDIEMPRMTGFELSEHVRSCQAWRDLPIIAITSLAGDADRAHGIRCGITDYMIKMDRDALIQTVSKYLPVGCQ